MRPLVFPCRTTHTRIFPKKHSFSYSYLLVGIPVGWQGAVGSFLSADLGSLPSQTPNLRPPAKPWFTVEAKDHLSRGTHIDGLRGKLEAYLKSEGENLENYAYTYLITAPRFLGHSFNPVSFWYLYSEKRELKAMILEVNNTFDERRMYFLKDTGTGVPDSLSAINEDGSKEQKTTDKSCALDPPIGEKKARSKFVKSWAKDFHVSPFNSRKGSYSLMAEDPLNRLENSNKPVNNTITLTSSQSHAKLVARVFSTTNSIDPSSLTRWETFKFLASWWWVGFVTYPRIVKEAGKLFFKRKLPVYYRPEVLQASIGRHETGDERAIAHSFRSLFHSLISQSDLSVPVLFESGISTSSSPELIIPIHLRQSPAPDPIHLKITTPLFYARLARHPPIAELMTSEIQNQDDKTRTLHVSGDPEAILRLFDRTVSPTNSANASFTQPPDSTTPTPTPTPNPSPLTLLPLLPRLRWSLFLLFKKFTLNKESPQRRLPFSLLDEHVILHQDASGATGYRRAMTKLLASDMLAFGIPEIIDAVSWLVKMMLCYLHVTALKAALVQVGWLECGGLDGTGTCGIPLGGFGVHIWWLLRESL